MKLDEIGAAEQQQRSIQAVSSPPMATAPATPGGRTGCHARSPHQPQEPRHHSLWASRLVVTATNHEYLRIRACLFFIHPHSFVNNFYTCFNLNRVEKCLSVYSLDEFKNIQDTKTCFGYFGYFGYFGWLTFQIFQPAVLPKFPSDQSFARPFERLRSVEANS